MQKTNTKLSFNEFSVRSQLCDNLRLPGGRGPAGASQGALQLHDLFSHGRFGGGAGEATGFQDQASWRPRPVVPQQFLTCFSNIPCNVVLLDSNLLCFHNALEVGLCLYMRFPSNHGQVMSIVRGSGQKPTPAGNRLAFFGQ